MTLPVVEDEVEVPTVNHGSHTIAGAVPQAPPVDEWEHLRRRMVVDSKDIARLTDVCIERGTVAIDTEAYGPVKHWVRGPKRKDPVVDSLTGKLAGVSLSFREDEGWYIPVAGEGPCADPGSVRTMLGRLAESCELWAHNWAYDLQIVRNFMSFRWVLERWGDTMVASWLANDGVWKRVGGKPRQVFGLKELVEHHWDYRMAMYTETVGDDVLESGPDEEYLLGLAEELTRGAVAKQKHRRLTKKIQNEVRKTLNSLREHQVWRKRQMHEVDTLRAARYAADDAIWTYRLALRCKKNLSEQGMEKVFYKLEMPVVELIVDMYAAGMPVNVALIDEWKRELDGELRVLREEWDRLVGCNIDSAVECREVLYPEAWPLEEETPRSAKTGEPSTGAAAVAHAKQLLHKSDRGYRIAEVKERYAAVKKLRSSYTDSFVEQLDSRPDGRLRTDILHTGTETGRFSSRNPNLQNVPRKHEGLPEVRQLFQTKQPNSRLAASDRLVASDWSQLELCITAHFSKDPTVTRIVLEGEDMHQITADALGVTRHQGKTINYALGYGGSAKKISPVIGEPLETITLRNGRRVQVAGPKAKAAYDDYREQYAGVFAFKKWAAEYARQHGYVQTLLGRRRYLPGINAGDKLERWHAERQAVNTIIQGSAADIAKLAGVQIHRRWKAKGIPARLLLQIHDEWLAECTEDVVETVMADMKEIMEGCVRLRVPLTAEVKQGKTWAECK